MLKKEETEGRKEDRKKCLKQRTKEISISSPSPSQKTVSEGKVSASPQKEVN